MPRKALQWLRPAVYFVIACVLTYGLEFWLDRSLERLDQPQNYLTQGLFDVAAFYHRLVTIRPRKASPRFTGLVILSSKASPPGISMLNVCPERRFLGELLKSLVNVHPRVVVIDKKFGLTTCPDDDPGTLNLYAGMQSLCTSHVRVIVGRLVGEDTRKQKNITTVYPLEPALSFRKVTPPSAVDSAADVPRLSASDTPEQCVFEGVVNTVQDNRRAGLWFPNVEPVETYHGSPPSLALAAALSASPNLLHSGTLDGLKSESPPYVSFVETEDFENYEVRARDLVCKSADPPGWRACTDGEIDPSVRAKLLASVVLIGEDDSGSDRHDTAVGEIPGYYLQANYIESLLDDRLIRPVPEIINIVAGFSVFVGFEFIAWYYHHHRVKALLRFAVLVLGSGLIVYFSVTLFGYYLNPTAIGVLAILLRVADLALMPAGASANPERA